MALGSREFAWLTGRVYRRAELAIANSRNTARMLEGFDVEPERIVVVYPGVDPDRFSPEVDGKRLRSRFAGSADLLLLSVGRLQRRKGHDLAISALASLCAELPYLKYVIAGDGEERQRLEQHARACGVSDRVFFTGAFPPAELPALYAACDVFLLPNRVDSGDIEGFGIVFLEAASSGKPVIAGNSGGVPEAVADGVTGLLVSGTDVAELASTVRALATDPNRRQQLGGAGRHRVLESFTWDRSAAAVEEAHRRACS